MAKKPLAYLFLALLLYWNARVHFFRLSASKYAGFNIHSLHLTMSYTLVPKKLSSVSAHNAVSSEVMRKGFTKPQNRHCPARLYIYCHRTTKAKVSAASFLSREEKKAC